MNVEIELMRKPFGQSFRSFWGISTAMDLSKLWIPRWVMTTRCNQDTKIGRWNMISVISECVVRSYDSKCEILVILTVVPVTIDVSQL